MYISSAQPATLSRHAPRFFSSFLVRTTTAVFGVQQLVAAFLSSAKEQAVKTASALLSPTISSPAAARAESFRKFTTQLTQARFLATTNMLFQTGQVRPMPLNSTSANPPAFKQSVIERFVKNRICPPSTAK